MMVAQFFIPGCLAIVKVLLVFTIQVYGTFHSKTAILCRMMRDLPCDGSFINSMNITCPNRWNRSLEQAKQSHGSKCNDNADCTTTVSFEGICLCKLGHYFSRGNNTCIKECSEYATKMDSYNGAGIRDHNNRKMKTSTLASCVEECVEEEEFTCVTTEYEPSVGHCLLSVDGYMDVEEKDRVESPGWVLSQRQCK